MLVCMGCGKCGNFGAEKFGHFVIHVFRPFVHVFLHSLWVGRRLMDKGQRAVSREGYAHPVENLRVEKKMSALPAENPAEKGGNPGKTAVDSGKTRRLLPAPSDEVLSPRFPQLFRRLYTGFSTLFPNFAAVLKALFMKKLTVEELQRLDVAAFREAEKLPLVVVLDNVRSLHNVGSVLRTADAFRVEEVVMCGITATPPSAEIHKTALGAEDSVAWRYAPDALAVVEALRGAGYTVLAVEQVEGSLQMGSFRPEPGRRYAVVFGNEVKGVQQCVVDACHQALEIPQFGTKHSLNVSVTAGMVMWEFARCLLLSPSR